MKRNEMLEYIRELLRPVTMSTYNEENLNKLANDFLTNIEKKGMKPPSVSEEDCQALMHVYMAGYTFNQWDEELAKDEKVQEHKTRKVEWDSKTLEEKKAIRKSRRDARLK